MKDSIKVKLETMVERFEELSGLLSDPEVIGDQKQFQKFSKEYSDLEPIVQCFANWQQFVSDLAEARELTNDADPDMREMGKEEFKAATAALEETESQLQLLLLPKDPNDGKNVFLEVRAGTGGDEAAIFSGDLFRMYSRFAENKGWRVEVMSSSQGEHGGFKEIITRISGEDVYSQLKFESGAHRVQRVPATESQGRVHTSACTVAVMPEADAVEEVNINPSELRIDTFRSSGAGGQHVNTTDSAIRITHLPTGLVVECQDERSQHKNKARALSVLAARLKQAREDAAASEISDARKKLVGSGDRSERIRTYNYPQSRVSDHRVNLTLYRLDEIMEGRLDLVIDPLLQEYQAELLTELDS